MIPSAGKDRARVDRLLATLEGADVADFEEFELAPRAERNSRCPGCGGSAETTMADLPGAGLRQTTVRCLADGPRCAVRVTHERMGLDLRPEVACAECGELFRRAPQATFQVLCPTCKAAKDAPKGYAPRPCSECQQEFTPRGNRAEKCDGCRNTLAPKPLTPAPDEPCQICGGLVPRGFRCDHMGADIITLPGITLPEEEPIMPTPAPPETPPACECGCGEPCSRDKTGRLNRYASRLCCKRASQNRLRGKALSEMPAKPQQAEETNDLPAGQGVLPAFIHALTALAALTPRQREAAMVAAASLEVA